MIWLMEGGELGGFCGKKGKKVVLWNDVVIMTVAL